MDILIKLTVLILVYSLVCFVLYKNHARGDKRYTDYVLFNVLLVLAIVGVNVFKELL